MRQWRVGFGLVAVGLILHPGCSDSTTADNDNASFREAVASYDGTVEQVVTSFTTLGETIVAFDAAMKSGEDVDPIADRQRVAIDAFLASLAAMEDAESAVRGDSTPGRITQPLVAEAVGVSLVLIGWWAFGQACGESSQRVSEHRTNRDEALEGMANADPEAIDAFSEAMDGMQSEGEDVVEDFGARVTTDLVLSPVKPVSVGGIVLKDQAGNKLREGVKVLAATKGCYDGPRSASCQLAVQRTDAAGRVQVPVGKLSLVASLEGYVRLAAKDVEVSAGTDTEVARALIPIAEATPEKVSANDNGGVVPGDAGVPPSDAGADAPEIISVAGGWFGIVRRDDEVDFYLMAGAGSSDIAVRRYGMVEEGGAWIADYEWLDCSIVDSPLPLLLATVPCTDSGGRKQDGFGVLRAQGGACSDLVSDEVMGSLIASALMNIDGSCHVSPYWDPDG